MQSFEEIEEQLWNYIDNRCSSDERLRITTLVATNAVWKKLYGEITATNSLLHTTEAEHTPMRFTKNVMEAVNAATIAPRTTQYLNHNFIRAIAVIMLVGMGTFLAYIIAVTDWSTMPTNRSNAVNLDWVAHPLVLQVAGFLLVMLLLAFFDGLLRRKSIGRNAPL